MTDFVTVKIMRPLQPLAIGTIIDSSGVSPETEAFVSTGEVTDDAGCDIELNGPQAHQYARLIAAAPEMYEALKNVQKIISEAAMTGFNWKDGDWPERLFASQQVTSRAIAKAEAR